MSTRRGASRPGFFVAVSALTGALAIAVGTFAPCLQVDLFGTLRYWDMGQPQAYGVMAAAAMTVVMVYCARPGWVVFSTLVLWAAFIYPWVRGWIAPQHYGFFARLGRAIVRAAKNTAWDIAISLDMVHWRWGTPTMAGGALLLSGAALIVVRGRLEDSLAGARR